MYEFRPYTEHNDCTVDIGKCARTFTYNNTPTTKHTQRHATSNTHTCKQIFHWMLVRGYCQCLSLTPMPWHQKCLSTCVGAMLDNTQLFMYWFNAFTVVYRSGVDSNSARVLGSLNRQQFLRWFYGFELKFRRTILFDLKNFLNSEKIELLMGLFCLFEAG